MLELCDEMRSDSIKPWQLVEENYLNPVTNAFKILL